MEMTLEGLDEKFYFRREVLITNTDIKSAFFTMWQERPTVEVVFTEAGSKKFAQITEENVGKRRGIIVDGQLVSAPIVNGKITGGKAVIGGVVH